MADNQLFNETVLQFFAPVRDYLADPEVSEVLINGPGEVYIERGGRLERTDRAFQSPESLLAAVRNVSQFVGRVIDAQNPYLDARLPDGSRLHAMLPPIARRGPYVSIRRFSGRLLTMADLVERGALGQPVAEFLRACVLARKNLVVSGGTGSGKTTLLNLLSSFIPAQERVIVIEDASELKLVQEHVLPMEARHADAQGRGAVTIRDLLACSLRLRPDRIVVGECRGGETLDMLQAMNTGHSGSLTTVHANSCRDALTRLETLALMSGVELPLTAVRGQVAAAVDLVVQVARLPDGSRRLTEIAEVLGLDPEGRYLVNPLFGFQLQGKDRQSGRVLGELRPSGRRPECLAELELTEAALAPDLFGPA